MKNTQFDFNDLDCVLAWWRFGKYSTSGHVVRWGGNSEAGNRFHIASSAGTLLSRCLKFTSIGSISWSFVFKAKWVIQFNWVDGPLMEFRAVSCLTKQVLVGAHLSITRRTIVQLFVRKRYCNLDAPNPQVNFPRLTQFKLCAPAFLSPSVSKCNTAVDKCAPKIWTIAKSSRLGVRVDFQCLTICQSGYKWEK